ncbi:unnamed protein product, partial [Rotaria sp. Silwood1]
MNPFQKWVLKSKSPSIDPRAPFAYESNRLDSFKKQNRETFAQVKIEELAYAGFYLDAAGTHVKYPWCIVELSEQRFEDIIRRRPSFSVLPLLNDEPWAAMHVHMHENEQLLDKDNSWCLWIRRKPDGHYRNFMM